MAKQGAQDRSELVIAAEAVEEELRKFEHHVEVSKREALSGQKPIERAARALRDVADTDERLGARLRELVDAITVARERQQATALAAVERAREVESRTGLLQELLKRYGELGQVAGQLNHLAQTIALQARDAVSPEQIAELFVSFKELQEQMGRAAEGATELVNAAETMQFTEVGREAESLRQSLLSSRNKLNLLNKNMMPS